MSDDSAEFNDDFIAKRITKQKARHEAIEVKRSAEARSMRASDGRVSTRADERGLAQLNVRVPIDLKNQVIEEKYERSCDVATVVADALRSYFNSKRRG